MNYPVIPIGEIARLQSGYAFKSRDWSDSGVAVVRIKNVKDGNLDLTDCAYVSEDVAKSAHKYRLHPGDILFSMTGYIGERAWVRSNDWIMLNQRVGRFVFDQARSSEVDWKYFFYAISFLPVLQELQNRAHGAAQPNISPKAVGEVLIPFPSLDQQRKIASILSAYDDLIENNTRRIETLEEMAQRLYEEWFVNFRFPGHEEVSFKESELGDIPEGWEVTSLESFGTILTGKTPSKKKPELFGSEVPFIKLPDMHGQIFITETTEGLSLEGEQSQRKKTVPANSICVSCIGTGGIVVITSEPSQTNQQINTIVPAQSDLREFLYFSALSLRDDINNYGATGATMTNLSRGKFASLKVIAPCEELVSSYSTLTAPMFDRILNLQRANRNLRAQRDLLLPKLVSGEIDVSDIPMPEDKEVEAA